MNNLENETNKKKNYKKKFYYLVKKNIYNDKQQLIKNKRKIEQKLEETKLIKEWFDF